MAITEQFAGLEMDKLIGAPLTAAADASLSLANATADFINRVGFDAEGKLRTAAFMYQKRSMNEDGTSNLDEMKVAVPMLAIVPIPNLQVDEVNILFDMEVKQSEKQDTSMDLGASVTGSLNLGVVKLSVTGSVSAHSSNTRSSDNSAKYHVDVRATNHGIPEGLARVLDMMAANISPSLVSSAVKGGNGQELSENAKKKAERLKTLRNEISQTEKRLSAAKDKLDGNITQLKRVATRQLNVYQSKITALLDALNTEDADAEKKAEAEKKAADYGNAINEINQSWNAYQNQAAANIEMVAGSGTLESEDLTGSSGLKALDDQGQAVTYDTTQSCHGELLTAQNKALASQDSVNKLEEELLEKKADYDDALAGKEPAPKLQDPKN